MKLLENKIVIISSVVVLLVIGIISSSLAYYFYNKSEEITCENESLAYKEDIVEDQVESMVYVDIKGAVKKPGVYELSSNDMINDAIKAAGGFNKNAYTNNINLSKTLENELVIFVYTKSEYKNSKKTEIPDNTVCVADTYNIEPCIEQTESIIVSSDTKKDNVNSNTNNNNSNDNEINTSDNVENNNVEITKDNGLININTASVSELSTLPGIGEKKAQAIIDYRNENGYFNNIEDIKNISGIGDATYEKFKDLITV